MNAVVIRDELRLAAERAAEAARPAFEKLLLSQRAAVEARLAHALGLALPTWQGNLAEQSQRYEAWMAERLNAELTPLSRAAAPVALDLLRDAEARLRRVVEAFRDRLGRNIAEATGVTVSPTTWEARQPQVAVVPVAVSRTFMTPWELLWWLLPMALVGGLFRRHVLGRVAWEVEKNLTRLAGDWSVAVDTAITDLRDQAKAWVETELATLEGLLKQPPAEVTAFREGLRRLEGTGLLRRREESRPS